MFFVLREMALQAASSAPLLSRPKRTTHSTQVYPYVFDALAEMQRATAFISDTKVFYNIYLFIYLFTSFAKRPGKLREQAPLRSPGKKMTKQMKIILIITILTMFRYIKQ